MRAASQRLRDITVVTVSGRRSTFTPTAKAL
jgi:hypothetical protein